MRRSFQLLSILVPLTIARCSGEVSYTFELPKEEIEKELATKFPMKPGSEQEDGSPLDLTLSNPVVLLEEGRSQVGLRVDVVAETAATTKLPALPRGRPGAPAPPAPDRPRFTGNVTVFASVKYDPDAKAIRLSDPNVADLQIAQLPDPLLKPLSRMAEKALAQKFAEQPIPLKSETALDKAATAVLKSVTVKDGKLLVEIGW
jgi:hypothetical protein